MQQFHFYSSGGERRVKTDSYSYSLALDKDLSDELLLWHWHPRENDVAHPHVHVCVKHPAMGELRKFHIPSGRVSFEQVVRFLIAELNVEAKRKDWEATLAGAESRFRTYRSWA